MLRSRCNGQTLWQSIGLVCCVLKAMCNFEGNVCSVTLKVHGSFYGNSAGGFKCTAQAESSKPCWGNRAARPMEHTKVIGTLWGNMRHVRAFFPHHTFEEICKCHRGRLHRGAARCRQLGTPMKITKDADNLAHPCKSTKRDPNLRGRGIADGSLKRNVFAIDLFHECVDGN